jgi:hypothetical protein
MPMHCLLCRHRSHIAPLVGVIVELEYFGQGNRMGRLTLESGEAVTVQLDRAERGGRGPRTGDLLLLGHNSSGEWFYALPGNEACFTLWAEGFRDLGHAIRFSSGLELRKADSYASALAQTRWPAEVRSCVDRHGEVTSAER